MRRVRDAWLVDCIPGDITGSWHMVLDICPVEPYGPGEDIWVTFLRPDGAVQTAIYSRSQPAKVFE